MYLIRNLGYRKKEPKKRAEKHDAKLKVKGLGSNQSLVFET